MRRTLAAASVASESKSAAAAAPICSKEGFGTDDMTQDTCVRVANVVPAPACASLASHREQGIDRPSDNLGRQCCCCCCFHGPNANPNPNPCPNGAVANDAAALVGCPVLIWCCVIPYICGAVHDGTWCCPGGVRLLPLPRPLRRTGEAPEEGGGCE